MAVAETALVIKAAPLPPNFRGSPQEFFEAMIARMKIVSPLGFTFFVRGGSQPTSDQGPWLKDNKEWWVWNEDEATYVPIDIESSLPDFYWVQEATPPSGSPPLWFKVTATTIQGIYFFVNGKWIPFTMTSGTTALRPTAPYDFQRYYDTDIQCEIWWERGAWRTVAGTVGDIKYVSWLTSDEALTRNPGWEVLGTESSANSAWRGRVIGQATKDAPGSPNARDLSVGAGITKRQPGDTFGFEQHTLIVDELPAHSHVITGANAASGGDQPDNRILIDEDHTANTDTRNTSNTGANQPHNNIQPTLALWCLRKT